jgi:proline dehydrogenase
MIDFENTRIAFEYKTSSDLRRTHFLFKMLSYPSLVSMANSVLKAALSVGLPIGWVVKPTVYRQFVGGTTIPECNPTVVTLGKFNIKAILDYSVEGGGDEQQIQYTLEETLRSIDNAGKNPNIPFAVFKPTAFGDINLLEKASVGATLTPGDQSDLEKYRRMVDTLCKRAHDVNIPILIDAEDSWYQPFIDSVVDEMMAKYNKEKVIVFNTFQMYRHDRLVVLEKTLEKSAKGGYYAGVKFVRGAYMEKERARAKKMGYPSPIYPDKDGTDKAFDHALDISMQHIDRVMIFCGTHNENSCLHLTKLMAEKGLAKDDPRVWISQLYGMSDHISFNLGAAGYNVVKYVPYGPVRSVMPYLFRRAEENTSIAGQTGRELRLLTAEKRRRNAS